MKLFPPLSQATINYIASLTLKKMLEPFGALPQIGSGLKRKLAIGSLTISASGEIKGKLNSATIKELKRYGVTKSNGKYIATEKLLVLKKNIDKKYQNYINDLDFKPGKLEPVAFLPGSSRVDKFLDSVGVKDNVKDKRKQIKIFNKNFKKSYDSFNKENIDKMRQEIQDATLKGGRSEDMIHIVNKYIKGIMPKRAKLIARQESVAAMSAYRTQRAIDAQIDYYKWVTAGDGERVRKSHQKLNGKIFAFKNPPYIDDKGTRKGHPGDDFYCRCLAMPVIKKKVTIAGKINGISYYKIM